MFKDVFTIDIVLKRLGFTQENLTLMDKEKYHHSVVTVMINFVVS